MIILLIKEEILECLLDSKLLRVRMILYNVLLRILVKKFSSNISQKKY